MSDSVAVALITASATVLTGLIAKWPRRRKKRRPREPDGTG
jgi:hypothetical protein